MDILNFRRLQNRGDVGDIFWMLVPDANVDSGCWWQNGRHQHLKVVTNSFRLQHPSPTSMLPNRVADGDVKQTKVFLHKTHQWILHHNDHEKWKIWRIWWKFHSIMRGWRIVFHRFYLSIDYERSSFVVWTHSHGKNIQACESFQQRSSLQTRSNASYWWFLEQSMIHMH